VDMDCICLAQNGLVPASCEYGNELSGTIKDGEFLDQLSVSYLLKVPTPWT
jgi:hypothetical protein